MLLWKMSVGPLEFQQSQFALLKPCSNQELRIRENFKRDYKLSCPVLDDREVFDKSLQIFGLEEEWQDYLKMANSLGTETFIQVRKDLRNKILSQISHLPEYQAIELNPKLSGLAEGGLTGPRTYLRDEICGKHLVSIDLVKGNYQALKYLDPKLVLGTQSYAELIGQFTDQPSLIKSKYFRQMVFGQLNPAVQGKVQRMMIEQVVSQVYQRYPELPIIHLTNDEVVFDLSEFEESGRSDILGEILQVVGSVDYELRVDQFRIEKIENVLNESWYQKFFLDDQGSVVRTRLMGVHVRYLFQIYNKVNGIEPMIKDYWWRERDLLSVSIETVV